MTLVDIRNLTKTFKSGNQSIKAVSDFNLQIKRGETLGLVGESGCGKSTVGRLLLQLLQPTEGQIFYDQMDLQKLKPKELFKMRRRMQMVFQDPYGSLNPRMTIKSILSEPLKIHRLIDKKVLIPRCQELLKEVGLTIEALNRFPREFSGGQRQRIGIARALALEPEFIIFDEAFSALDVSIQAQVVNLLKELQVRMNLTYLFIAHNLAIVRYISDRVAVMYLGQLMELGPTESIYTKPLHPYTQALLDAIPIPDPVKESKRTLVTLKGEVPSPINLPSGCPFHTRCPKAIAICKSIRPKWQEVAPDHYVACHLIT